MNPQINHDDVRIHVSLPISLIFQLLLENIKLGFPRLGSAGLFWRLKIVMLVKIVGLFLSSSSRLVGT